MEVKLDAVEYMNELCTWNNPPKWSDRWSKKVAWACEIIVERDERISELEAQLAKRKQWTRFLRKEMKMGDELFELMTEKGQEWQGKCFELEAAIERLADALEELVDALDGYEMLAALDADVYRKAQAALDAAKEGSE